MDHERAETYLRQLAEAELRCDNRSTRFSEAVRALTAVGAVDAELAVAIGYDLELARRARQRAPRPGAPRFSAAMPVGVRPMIPRPARPAKASPGTSLVAPVGLRVPVPHGDVRGEIFLLAYLRNTSGARIAIHAWGAGDGDPGMWLSARGLTVGDDSGRRYSLYFLGGGSGGEWNGELWFDPAPPAGARWLDLILAGEPARRISLDRTAVQPAVTMTGTVVTPGEHYLQGVAYGLLCGNPPTRGMGAAGGRPRSAPRCRCSGGSRPAPRDPGAMRARGRPPT
jgi:hypothetical protein